jgi:hypothetical protein
MRLDARKPLVVLTGAWNPAIFNPGWVGLHLLGRPEGQTVNVRLVQTLPDVKQVLYVADSDIGYYTDSTRVEFYSNSYDTGALAAVTQMVARLLEALPHTPFGDFGVNFNFVEDSPSTPLLDKLQSKDGLDGFYRIATQEFLARILYGDKCQLNLKRVATASAVAFEFNYHHSLTNVADLMVITTGYLETLLKDSKEKLQQIYDGVGDEIISHDFSGAWREAP